MIFSANTPRQILMRRDPDTGDVCALLDRQSNHAIVYRHGEFPAESAVPHFDSAHAAVAWMQRNPGEVCLVNARLAGIWGVRLGRTQEIN